ncbi:MAG: gamma-glutamyl-gamma-aminobutyrate hydrolase family protein [Lachnospiraceae bacterium]|nr:gamma-glutamyl-gamma-aminobutyrate hydrolase family protein [Lachnospiraceae bacterium]
MPHVLIAGDERKTHNYINALLRAGASCDSSFFPLSDHYDALLLPGGGDIDPAYWNQTDQSSKNIIREEDEAQFLLLNHFFAHRKPILGICKGMQLINVYFGGSLIQDLPTAALHSFNETDQYHMTYIKKDSYLESLYGKAIITNSAHHQGIDTLGRHLTIDAITKDNVVEAISHTKLPIIGVQWHPERMPKLKRNVYFADGDKLLSYFLSLI